jgi:hypothetical protein
MSHSSHRTYFARAFIVSWVPDTWQGFLLAFPGLQVGPKFGFGIRVGRFEVIDEEEEDVGLCGERLNREKCESCVKKGVGLHGGDRLF